MIQRNGLLFVISGPSGTGKTSLCAEVLKKVSRLVRSVSYTTRPPRLNEKDGLDYHFVTYERFRDKVEREELVEWVEYHGHFYGTSQEVLKRELARGKDLLLAIETQGAQKIKARFPDVISVFLLPPSLEVLEERLMRRNTETKEGIEGRLAQAEQEIRLGPQYEYVIVNDELDAAVEKLRAIILAARSRSSRFDFDRFFSR